MRNNILGGLVIFMVVLTCLLLVDDITNPQKQTPVQDSVEVETIEQTNDLAIVNSEQ